MERKRKPMSEEQAFNALAAQCATAEYCPDDMKRKMAAWELPDGAPLRILRRLADERFIDENRYAAAFARDKSRYNKWGARRIALELQRRHIAPETIEQALGEIDEADAEKTLCDLLRQKLKSTKGRNAYEVNTKLIRFAVGRGFSFEQAKRCIEQINHNDDPDDMPCYDWE